MFFTQINQMMNQSVDITMVIRKSATGMTVSVLPKSNGLKDEAQNRIVPLTLSGLPEELDAGFIGAISKPIQKVSGLLTNMAEFEKQVDKGCRRQQGGEGSESQGDEGGEREAREVREAHKEGGGTDCSQEAQGCHRHTRSGKVVCYRAKQEDGGREDRGTEEGDEPGQPVRLDGRSRATAAHDTAASRTDATAAATSPVYATAGAAISWTATDTGAATGIQPACTAADATAAAIPVSATGSLSASGTGRTASALRQSGNPALPGIAGYAGKRPISAAG